MGHKDIRRELRQTLLNGPLNVFSFDWEPIKVISPLLSLLLDLDKRVRWHAVSSIGLVVEMLYKEDQEKARVILRRLMWQLNDESGGIGWGCPETMGEILFRVEGLSKEFSKILVSYIYEDQNYLEYPPLLQGAFWGIARVSKAHPEDVWGAKKRLLEEIKGNDIFIKIYSLLALGNFNVLFDWEEIKDLLDDKREFEIYWDEKFQNVSISLLANKLLKEVEYYGTDKA